jgi:GNAT superfamily N-acetyltransferase
VDTRYSLQQLRFDEPVVQALVAELQQEFVVRYGGPDSTPLAPREFDPPSGAFFVAFHDGQPVGMGGWRMRPDVRALGGTTAAEIKRMYVVPAARGQGCARAILAALESSAQESGADVLVLESGEKQPEALALYASAGYVPVPGFGIYRDSPLARSLGKRLSG